MSEYSSLLGRILFALFHAEDYGTAILPNFWKYSPSDTAPYLRKHGSLQQNYCKKLKSCTIQTFWLEEHKNTDKYKKKLFQLS